VGPLAALAIVTESKEPTRRAWMLATGGVVLAVAGLAFRPRFRARMIDFGVPGLTVQTGWVAAATLIVIALVVCSLVLDRRAGRARRVPLNDLHGEDRRLTTSAAH